METITQYKANDGKVFDKAEECLEYEAQADRSNKVAAIDGLMEKLVPAAMARAEFAKWIVGNFDLLVQAMGLKVGAGDVNDWQRNFGFIPCADSTIVEVLRRDGWFRGPRAALNFEWSLDDDVCGYDIVLWRPSAK